METKDLPQRKVFCYITFQRGKLVEINKRTNKMKDNEPDISLHEAKQALNTIETTKQQSNVMLRPPLWLNIIIASLYGFMTFSWASLRHENLWALGLIVSSVCFFIAVALYLYLKHLAGIKPKLTPKSRAEFIFHLVMGIIFALVIILSRELSINGFIWAAYLGGAINTLALSYTMHNFANNEFSQGKVFDE